MNTPSLMVNIPETESISYPIWIEKGLLNHPEQWLPHPFTMDHYVIITDDQVKPLYGDQLLKKLEDLGLNAFLISFPAGEHSKNRTNQQIIEETLFRAGCNRKTMILALGGGVAGDLAGFVAATYMRGIPYLQIPTSFLAMVDSSVGGKTAIDTPFGKNLIGAFWQPIGVIADLDCLNTLPTHHLVNGFVEALKMFLTHDAKSFQYAQKNLNQLFEKNSAFLKSTLEKAVQIKAQVVQADEKEQQQRATLNFGHTIGHGLEILSQYELLHGFAVALGILVEAKISEILGILTPENYEEIKATFLQLGIRGDQLQYFDVDALIQSTELDKKARAGKAHYVLLKTLGETYHPDGIFTHSVSNETVKEAFCNLCRIHKPHEDMGF